MLILMGSHNIWILCNTQSFKSMKLYNLYSSLDIISDKIKEHEIDGACSMCAKDKKCINIFSYKTWNGEII